jgi:hypothetical protein
MAGGGVTAPSEVIKSWDAWNAAHYKGGKRRSYRGWQRMSRKEMRETGTLGRLAQGTYRMARRAGKTHEEAMQEADPDYSMEPRIVRPPNLGMAQHLQNLGR